jgi:hypothetical protein
MVIRTLPSPEHADLREHLSRREPGRRVAPTIIDRKKSREWPRTISIA